MDVSIPLMYAISEGSSLNTGEKKNSFIYFPTE